MTLSVCISRALLLLTFAATAQAAPPAEDVAAHVRVVHSFAFGADKHSGGARPRPLMKASDGNLYGVAYAGGRNDFGTIYRVKPGGVVSTVFSFHANDGYGPEGTLVQASDGYLYGVTSSGGAGGNYPAGTVFRFDPATRVLTTLHTFFGDDGSDPGAGLIQATDGHLYGVTGGGGQFGAGTVFRVGLDGSFQTIYHFGTGPRDGGRPLGALMQKRDGLLCGTTYWGGARNSGTVYCLTMAGQMSVVRAFPDDGGATSPLIEGDDGSLLGTANFGGSQGQGSLFKLRPDGHMKVMDLWARPSGGLLKASDGNYYGTVFWGGQYDKGWVYRITPAGKLSEVHSFNDTDGSSPDGELLEVDGRLLGVTEGGGTTDSGVLFSIAGKLTPRGKR